MFLTNFYKLSIYLSKVLYLSAILQEEILVHVYAEFLPSGFPSFFFFSASSETFRRENDVFSATAKAVRERRGVELGYEFFARTQEFVDERRLTIRKRCKCGD